MHYTLDLVMFNRKQQQFLCICRAFCDLTLTKSTLSVGYTFLLVGFPNVVYVLINLFTCKNPLTHTANGANCLLPCPFQILPVIGLYSFLMLILLEDMLLLYILYEARLAFREIQNGRQDGCRNEVYSDISLGLHDHVYYKNVIKIVYKYINNSPPFFRRLDRYALVREGVVGCV